MTITNFPVLTTERLTLRRLSMDDKENIFALRSDPKINLYLNRPASTKMEDAVNFIQKINDNISKNTTLYWSIILSGTQEFVGTICLYGFSDEKNMGELGYELLTGFQGKGLMLEAVQKVIDYAFHSLKLQKLLAVTHRNNQSSTNLLSRLAAAKSIERDNENPELLVFTISPLHET